MSNWQHVKNGNVECFQLDDPEKGFLVSFNPKPMGNERVPETALINKVARSYFILEGDFRTFYEELFPKGWDDCLTFYREHKANNGSPFSADADPEVSKKAMDAVLKTNPQIAKIAKLMADAEKAAFKAKEKEEKIN
jgi:hypothetical protein